MSRGFGFLRFPDLEKSKTFVESNYPMIYLNGNGLTDSDDQAAKIRIAYSRERDDRNRGEKADGEWVCKNVSTQEVLKAEALLIYGMSSALSSTFPVERNVFVVKTLTLVCFNETVGENYFDWI